MDCSFQPACFDNEAARRPLKFLVLAADNLMNARGLHPRSRTGLFSEHAWSGMQVCWIKD